MKSAVMAVCVAFAAAAAPPISDKAGYARWMVSNMTWGVISTTSTMSTIQGMAFGNPTSYAALDDGTPVFCVSGLDQSIIDLQSDSRMSLTMSRASADDGFSACAATAGGDPENPPCSRVVLSGTFDNVTDDETSKAVAALNATHPAMDSWGCFGGDQPSGHDFYLAKLTLSQVWLINMYGGAAVLTAADYFNATA
mmetsp:Transcript_8457/g.21742  ORF Transcript_8457/g.21742 Transcript_8457/m.21742 type:complete len:196 (-) Transcript_8457:198-785(-)